MDWPLNICSQKEFGKSFDNKTKPQQSKVKLLQQEIQVLKNENKNLKEENKSHLKIIELLSTGHESDTLLRNYSNYNPAKTCITNTTKPFSVTLVMQMLSSYVVIIIIIDLFQDGL